jgi:hypothetical protein
MALHPLAALAAVMAAAAIEKPTTARQAPRADIASLSRSVVTIRADRITGEGIGSGLILDSTGVIVTAAHVIKGVNSLVVRLTSGEELDVEGIAEVDPRLDLAILRVAGFGMPAARLGNSDSVRLGDRIFAIGSPLGLERSVSDGLLSSFRINEGVRLMQISAPVSPGSSGGPIFAEDGAVVGIVISGIRGGGAENLNFALPINYVRGKLALLGSRKLLSVAEAPSIASQVIESATPTPPSSSGLSRRVHADLNLDYATLDGAELWSDRDDEQGARHITQVVYQIGRDANGRQTLERTLQDRVRIKVAALRSADALIDRIHSVLSWGDAPAINERFERTPKMAGVAAATWAIIVESGQALMSGTVGQRTTPVPLGTITANLVGATVAALPDSLPRSVFLTVFDPATGTVSQQRVDFDATDEFTVPVAQPGKPCDEGKNTEKRALQVTWTSTTFGATRDRYAVLSRRPHLRIEPKTTKCLRLP